MKKFLLFFACFMFALNLSAETLTEQFFKACDDGKTAEVNMLVKEKGVDVNTRDLDGLQTGLMRAGLHGHSALIYVLKALGADLDLKDSQGKTALMHTAWLDKNIETASALVKLGADIKIKDDNGMTAEANARESGQINMAEFLSEIRINRENEGIKEIKARQSLEAYVEKTFSKDEELVQKVLGKFIKALRKAAMRTNDNQDLTYALSVVARVENIDFMKRVSASFPDLSVAVDLLTEVVSKPNDDDSKNLSAQSSASAEEKLIERFFKACSNGKTVRVKRLVEIGVDVNTRDMDGLHSGLMRAGLHGHTELIYVLKALGADLDLKDGQGKTALMHTAWLDENIPAADALVKLGANLKAKDKKGRTAEDHAREHGKIKMAEFLSESCINQENEETASKQRLEAYVGNDNKFPNDADLVRTVLEKFIEDIAQNNYDIPPRVLAIFARKENWDFMKKASASFPELYEPMKFLADGFLEANTSGLENPFTKTNLQEIQNEFIKKGETLKLVGRLVGR